MKKFTKQKFIEQCSFHFPRLDLESIDDEQISIIDENGVTWSIYKSVVDPYDPSLNELEISIRCNYMSKHGINGLLKFKWERRAYIYKKTFTTEGMPFLEDWVIQVWA